MAREASQSREKSLMHETPGAVQHEMLTLLKRQSTATVDDVRERIEIPDSAVMRIGPAINALARNGQIVRVDRASTQRRKAHGREVKVWKLAE